MKSASVKAILAVIAIVILGCIVLIASVYLDSWLNSVSIRNIVLPDAATGKFALEIVAVLLVGLFNPLLGGYLTIRNPEQRTTFTASDHLLLRWLNAMSTIAVVLLAAVNEPGWLAAIGVYPGNGTRNVSVVFGGIAAISGIVLLFVLILRLVQRLRKKGAAAAQSPDPSNPMTAETMKYRDWRERFAYLTLLPFMVISEDLVTRGFLIGLIGNRTGTYVPWVVISVILSVIAHLYQGRNARTAITHFIYASLFAAAFLVFHNILAVSVMHVYINLIVTVGTWRQPKIQGDTGLAAKFSGWKTAAYLLFIGVNGLILFAAMIWLS